ncbi:hypothetical protein GWQ44_00905 [Pseudomonas sp. 3MA1]|uniref:hypothetical protein n=1 Tax=Pseudomonas sp. 3MA1 TaxID=2699196 RepID=UPI0023DDFD38|nr:hypothetical protein [Pseudomonas sp. 3MA1]MDF2394087.1 hypothetical protein [Pseudomonas sp. 3MA1]
MAYRKRNKTKGRRPKQTRQAKPAAPVQQVKAETEVVKPAVAESASKAVDPELTGIRQVVGKFRKSLEESGLGDLDLSGLFSGQGLLTPFVAGMQSAIKAQNIQAVTAAAVRGEASPENELGNTAKNLKHFDEAVERITLNVGVALLPAINSIVTGLQPALTSVGQFVADNPGLVEGLAAAAIAFTVAASAATVFAALSSPIGLAMLAIAAVAGVVVANWKPVSRFFIQLWGKISPTIMSMVGLFKEVFAWTPIGQLIANWEPVSAYLSALWQDFSAGTGRVYQALNLLFNMSGFGLLIRNLEPIREAVQVIFRSLREVFEWSPLGLISSNWQPVVGLFAAIWDLIWALSITAKNNVASLFSWSPGEGMRKDLDGLIQWFSSFRERLEKVLEPIREKLRATFGNLLVSVTGSINSLTESVVEHNNSANRGEDSLTDTPSPLLTPGNLPQSSSSLLQQAAANNRTRLEGGLLLRFENAPAGLRAEQAKTNQPGLNVASTLGYRSLSLGGSHGG